MAAKIKKGDKVIVLTGRDKGVKGEVLKVIPEKNRAIVSGVNKVQRHNRPSPFSPGGIEEKEATIHLSNLAHYDPATGKPGRVGFKTLEDGKKVRVFKGSGEVIDA